MMAVTSGLVWYQFHMWGPYVYRVAMDSMLFEVSHLVDVKV